MKILQPVKKIPSSRLRSAYRPTTNLRVCSIFVQRSQSKVYQLPKLTPEDGISPLFYPLLENRQECLGCCCFVLRGILGRPLSTPVKNGSNSNSSSRIQLSNPVKSRKEKGLRRSQNSFPTKSVLEFAAATRSSTTEAVRDINKIVVALLQRLLNVRLSQLSCRTASK